MKDIVVVGAGIGGLVTAAALSRLGYPVTVLEAHVYAGGCAGTFYHQGFRFDAGATLTAGFYPGGPMDLVAQASGIETWQGRTTDLAMLVHMPDGERIPRWGDSRRQHAYQDAFTKQAKPFWNWQENTADALWDLAVRLPTWPPQSAKNTFELISTGLYWASRNLFHRISPGLLADVFRPVASHLKRAPERLRTFIDAQLLISAQTTSEYANALYGASALDLPRRGVRVFEGGTGSIAARLVQAIRDNGGKVLFRHDVNKVNLTPDASYEVLTRQGPVYQAGKLVFNLPAWNISNIMGNHAPSRLHRNANRPVSGWGAFMTYIGVDGSAVPTDLPLHHQVLTGQGLGEGESIFLSISPAWDTTRGPNGGRAITISTHTRLQDWWNLKNQNLELYESKKSEYLERVIQAASKIIPHVKEAAQIILPGTPVTFNRFTGRMEGWVGGFPQTNLFQAWGPRLGPDLWMVGDSIFPGQSIAATALGGLNAAKQIQWESERDYLPSHSSEFPPSQPTLSA